MSATEQPQVPTFRQCLRIGLAGARANILPGLILQAFAGSLVAAYYLIPSVAASLESFAAWKSQAGYFASLIGTGLFGGFIPWLYQRFTLPDGERPALRIGLFLTAFWGLRGVDVDFLYRVQASLFGNGNDLATLAIKVFVDQFIICVFWAVPVTAIAYAWKDAGFNAHVVLNDLRGSWYRRRVLPMLISNLFVWVPTCALVYALPLALQIPLFNLVLCFFTLLLAHVARHTHDHSSRGAQR